jgi:hypothetical protein
VRVVDQQHDSETSPEIGLGGVRPAGPGQPSAGTISLSGDQVTVRIDRRAYSPVLRQASLPPDTTIPRWHGRRLHFEFS